MRLTKQQHTIISTTVSEIFGTNAEVWLFGSRVDDNKHGGDIDLLIETNGMDANEITRAEISFQSKLQAQLGEQKIDVLVAYPSRKSYPPIFYIAKQTGILL